jgi:hypothetical protein
MPVVARSLVRFFKGILINDQLLLDKIRMAMIDIRFVRRLDTIRHDVFTSQILTQDKRVMQVGKRVVHVNGIPVVKGGRLDIAQRALIVIGGLRLTFVAK